MARERTRSVAMSKIDLRSAPENSFVRLANALASRRFNGLSRARISTIASRADSSGGGTKMMRSNRPGQLKRLVQVFLTAPDVKIQDLMDTDRDEIGLNLARGRLADQCFTATRGP